MKQIRLEIRSAVGLFFIFCFLFFILPKAEAAFEINYAFGARAMAMAGAYTAVKGECDSILWNPAGLAGVGKFQVSSMYTNPFGVDGLSRSFIAAAKGFRRFSVASAFSKFAWNDYYGENAEVFAFSLNGKGGLSAGAALKLMSFKAEGVEMPSYSLSDRIGLDVGFIIPFGDASFVGISFANVNSPEILKLERKVNPRIGFSFYPVENWLLAADFWSEENKNGESSRLGYSFGTEYSPMKGIFFRAGLNGISVDLGCGFEFGVFRFDWSFEKFNEIFYDNQRFSLAIKF